MSEGIVIVYGVAMWLAGVVFGCFVPFLWARIANGEDEAN